MQDQLQQLEYLQEYIISQLSATGAIMDHSFDSLEPIDQIFEKEYKAGELINPDSTFAKKEGMILAGFAAYLAHVLIKNTTGSVIKIDTADENWYVNFEVINEKSGWSCFPGQRVLKRKLEGDEADLTQYAKITSDYLNGVAGKNAVQETKTSAATEQQRHQPWWKFWKK